MTDDTTGAVPDAVSVSSPDAGRVMAAWDGEARQERARAVLAALARHGLTALYAGSDGSDEGRIDLSLRAAETVAALLDSLPESVACRCGGQITRCQSRPGPCANGGWAHVAGGSHFCGEPDDGGPVARPAAGTEG